LNIRRLTIFILLILMIQLFTGCFASKEEKMRQRALPFYNEAFNYFLNGKLGTARDKILLAIDKFPHFVEAHILYQRIRASNLETKDLLKEYRRLMKENPNDAVYIYLYTRLLDDLEEQERLYKKVTDLDPDNGWGYFGLGWVYYKNQRFSDAADHLEQAVKLDNSNAIFHLNLGAVYFLMKHNHDAEVELKKAVEISPKLVEGWLDLATVYYQRAEFDKAVESLRKYINLYPAAPDKEKTLKIVMQLSGGKF